ncbi:MAG: HAD-IG family 5'-nucleotidase [Bdellovibrionales bacterium]
MDHTLVRYKTENFERLAYESMRKKLLEDLNYPAEIQSLEFDFTRAIRGLIIDKVRGNILKLSRHAAIRESYHGTNSIQFSQQKQIYKSTYIDLGDPDYDAVDTSFSYSFATLFAQLVDLKDGALAQKLPDYAQIAVDLTHVLDRAHRDGTIKDEVGKNLDHYIIKDPAMVQGLEQYKKHGKKIFVLTNSEYFYTKTLMEYAIDPFLEHCDSWTELFEFVITMAQKPRFFYDRLGFLKINLDDGTMTNAYKIEPGCVYQGGCADLLTRTLHLSPEEILYIGDHIYGDIVRLKKECAWRTALVVEEIEEEIKNSQRALPIVEKIDALMNKKLPIESEINELISEQIIKDHKKFEGKIKTLFDQVTEIDKQISPLIKEQRACFNKYWGEVFRTGIEESYFAYQVDRFACIYMGKLEDLLKMSPRTYFRSNKKPLSHEIKLFT